MGSIRRNGYAAALIGAWCGAIPVISVAALLTWWLATREWVEPGQRGGTSTLLLGALVATIILAALLSGYYASIMGAVLGCWLALELRGHHLAGYTASTLCALLMISSLLLYFAWAELETLWSGTFALGVLAFNLVAAPVLARGIVLLVVAAD